MILSSYLSDRGAECGLVFTTEQLMKFEIYYNLLLEYNKVMNLTNIVAPEDFAVKHIIDSLLGYHYDMFAGKTLADVGTGAGFPGLPLKIYCPSVSLSLIDSLAKRLNFLQAVVDNLELEDVKLYHCRAEDAGQTSEHRERYDVVTARAVAALPVLAEYCLPLVKLGGSFLVYKGPKYSEELNSAKKALRIFGGVVAVTEEFLLPGNEEMRAIITITKKHLTPQAFPRKAGLPGKNPL